MFFLKPATEQRSLSLFTRAFLLNAIFAVSSVVSIGYADEDSLSSSRERSGSTPTPLLFPEVIGSPWVQQLGGIELQTESWIHISSQAPAPESVTQANKTGQIAGKIINLALQEADIDASPIIVPVSGFSGGKQPKQGKRRPSRLTTSNLSNNIGGEKDSCSCMRVYCSRVSGFSQEELAPAQHLSRQPWRSPIGIDPWIDVLQAEKSASVTFFGERSIGQSDHSGEPLAGDVPVTRLSLNIQPEPGRMPEQRGTPAISNSSATAGHTPEANRNWRESLVHWNAPETTHGPLYFEEPNLERHGYSRGYWQPLVSGLRFFSTAPLLPGLMTLDRPFTLQYELGESRVGSFTPYRARKIPWNAKSLLVEIGVVSGFSFIIP